MNKELNTDTNDSTKDSLTPSDGFFVGPKGEDIFFKKVFPNRAALETDLGAEDASEIKVGDYVLVSYGVYSTDTDSEYQKNKEIDKEKGNFNACVYQKVLKLNTEKTENIQSKGSNYEYKFIVMLINDQQEINIELEPLVSSAGAIGGEYQVKLIKQDELNNYKLTFELPPPAFSQSNTENGKVYIYADEMLVGTFVPSILPGSNYGEFKIDLSSGDSTFKDAVEIKLNENLGLINGSKWVIYNVEVISGTDTSHYEVILVYYYQPVNENSYQYKYYRINGDSINRDYLTNNGIIIESSDKSQATKIHTDTGLIATGSSDIILPGQIVKKKTLTNDDQKYYIKHSNDNLYFEPSPLEKKLVDELNIANSKLSETNNNLEEISEKLIAAENRILTLETDMGQRILWDSGVIDFTKEVAGLSFYNITNIGKGIYNNNSIEEKMLIYNTQATKKLVNNITDPVHIINISAFKNIQSLNKYNLIYLKLFYNKNNSYSNQSYYLTMTGLNTSKRSYNKDILTTTTGSSYHLPPYVSHGNCFILSWFRSRNYDLVPTRNFVKENSYYWENNSQYKFFATNNTNTRTRTLTISPALTNFGESLGADYDNIFLDVNKELDLKIRFKNYTELSSTSQSYENLKDIFENIRIQIIGVI